MTPAIRPTIRSATCQDVPAILDIYNDAVLHTTASYDLEPVSLQSRLDWFDAKAKGGWPLLVAEQAGAEQPGADQEGQVVGFATFGPFREKAGYAGTVEHSVYVRDGLRGGGIGLALMEPLLTRAREMGLHVMVGGIDAENAGSLRFHERLGFTQVAHMQQVGRKFDRWLDLVFVQRLL